MLRGYKDTTKGGNALKHGKITGDKGQKSKKGGRGNADNNNGGN